MTNPRVISLITCLLLTAAPGFSVLNQEVWAAETQSPAAAPPAGTGFAANPGRASAPVPGAVTETKEQRDARMQWWREARFGMFIHWGIYSVPAGVYKGKNISGIGEWIMNSASIPVAEYKNFATEFNPTQFDADRWASLAKAAGMKYVVITSKHHDGFALFNTSDPFSIMKATPIKRDIIKELDDACRRQGLRFGVYYSQSQDWSHPGGYAYGRNGRRNGEHWDPTAQEGSFDDYLRTVAIPQTKELLTNYKLDVLWWDTSGPITAQQAQPLHDLLSLQPGIISNNRLGGGFRGDTETPEQTIPPTGFPDRDWETCMTVNDTWGYKSTDTHWKSEETLLRNLIDIASKGGNYLLNVGPTAEGIIPQPEVDRLQAMGKWLALNGEAIYATGPTPWGAEAGSYITPATAPAPAASPAATRAAATRPRFVPTWVWRATTKPNKIYLHIFQWPQNGSFRLPPMPATYAGRAPKVYLLSDPSRKAIPAVSDEQGVYTLSLPREAPDPVASVICLDFN